MTRVTSALALSGCVLLTTWAVAPAAPPPGPPLVRAADLKAFDQSVPVLADVNAQVERLQQRPASPPEFPAPARDPFRFGRRPEPARPKVENVPARVDAPVVVTPLLPRLVAILADTTDGTLVRTAALAVGEGVEIVKPGDTVGPFVVRSIGSDALELADPLSGATFQISIR
jgi:hypothetical protein